MKRLTVMTIVLAFSVLANAGTQAIQAWNANKMSAQAIIFHGINLMKKTENKSPVSIGESVKCFNQKQKVGANMVDFYRCDVLSQDVYRDEAPALYNALYHAVINGLPVKIRGYDYVVSDGETFLICEDRYKGNNPYKIACTFY